MRKPMTMLHAVSSPLQYLTNPKNLVSTCTSRVEGTGPFMRRVDEQNMDVGVVVSSTRGCACE